MFFRKLYDLENCDVLILAYYIKIRNIKFFDNLVLKRHTFI